MFLTRTDVGCRTKTAQKTESLAPVYYGPHVDLDLDIPLPESMLLDYGILKQSPAIRARIVGPQHAPAVFVLGGISANRNPADRVDGTRGWWRELIGQGCAVDTRNFRVVSFDFFPSDELAQEAIQTITPNDQARLANLVCEALGIEKLHTFIGASYGGMVGLGFALLFPQKLERLVVACAAHRPHPMGTAWRSIQRKIVRFGIESGQPQKGISLARELGMTTYRTSKEFGERFDRTIQHEESGVYRFDVEHYLEHHGQEFVGRMTPERYLRLSESIDLHAVDPQHIQVPVTLIACRQDQLVPVEEVRLLHQQLAHPATRYEFDSVYGHDAFLKETQVITDILATTFRAPANS